MKKIIDNKIYDTEKAEIIYSFRERIRGSKVLWSDDLYYYNWYEGDIYKTKKGNYFVHYQPIKREYNCEQFIKETTENYVKDIIKQLDADKYIELFGNELEEA